MVSYNLSKRQARSFLLRHQRLVPGGLSEGKNGIYEFVRHVGCIQYDPLNITGHNHELVLQARLPGFLPEMAAELLYKDRLLFDGWDKNMSIYCTEDWPYFQRRREAAALRYQNNEAMSAMAAHVREELMSRGPLSSLDLESKEKIDWAWAPARLSRAAMESMYFWGELSIHHRVHTRRYYDFTANLLPEELLRTSDPNVTEEQHHDWYVLRRIGSIGLQWNKSGDGWLGISGMKSKERTAAVQRLLQRDLLREVQVEGLKLPLYVRTADTPVLEALLQEDAGSGDEAKLVSSPDYNSPPEPPAFAAVLAPLDNLLWDRELIRQLFGFHYRWEVYKPVQEREYGYYVLPLLYDGRFIARLEPVMNRKSGVLTIVRWWWEPEASLTAAMLSALTRALTSLARTTGAASIRFDAGTVTSCGLQELEAVFLPDLQQP
ncbi:DNA glycosylase AlkZ-like family protein [Paenibacillus sp. MMS20-IR301]|uniref:winged helix-turn-helix domain-containing protein n=1 Tax=Paenibacillus sp. MMS20-IR301 TaxID=2895946 RepID=UPI0028E7080A|nr:crosslink repair DNA glycosylase YcaQ family protein [Paenibacillus sp. MMS20-IR301]WNS44938.1 crosslink repair DNA glycosylase YcaQ family protein [Paenibacillus sp. MMS20-IR301]